MRNILILIIFLSPICASAQILRAYGVIEVGSFPTSSATGPKFAYRPADSSFYRWVSGSTWLKIIPDEPDTLYLKQLSGTTALVDGDIIDISTYFLKSDTTSAFASYLKRPVGWGLSLLTGKYPFVDSSKVASRYYVSTSPTTIAANYAAVSNGTNLIARNLFDNNTYAGVIGRPWKFGEYTTAGLPTGVTGYHLFNTTLGYTIFYDGTQYLPVGFWSKSGSNLSYLLGKVGIGQSSPTATLDIKEAAQTTSMVDIYNPSQTPYAMRIFNEAYSTSNPVFAYFAYNNGRFAMGNLRAADYELFVNGYTNPSLTILGSNGAIKIGGNSGATGNTYLFKNGNIGMGTASPSYTLDIAWTDAARFFGGTTAQRPTRAARLIRYNSDSLGFEIANSTTWLKLLNRTDLIFQNSRSGNNVSIRIPGGTGTTFSVSDPDTLTVSGSTLSVSGGNSVTLPWLKTQLESGQSVHIKATTGDTLSIKNAPIQLKGSTGATAILLSPAGVVELRKDNYLDFRDTITTMEMYSAIKSSVSNPTYMGVGWENTLYHPELGTAAAPGSRFRRLQSILADTTGASGILRIWNGPEYQGTTIKTTQTFFGLGEAEPSFTFISRSTGNGNPAFQMKAVNPFFEIKQNGSFYAGADSSLKFNATLKTLQLSAYGTPATTAPSQSKTESGYVASFSTDGTVTSYKLARDTFIEDVTLFSVGTLMNACQELTIVSSMTAAAPTHQEIRFPDAADELRGKKIIVYSKKKDAGSFVPQIKVVGGVSRLYFTTNPAIGGTDPSDQSTLSIDDSVWSDHGTTFEFTCLRIDNTPNYRWVLKQR